MDHEENDTVATLQPRKVSTRPIVRGSSRKSLMVNDDDEVIQLRDKIRDLQGKIKDYQTKIYDFESLLNRNEMEKDDLLKRLDDRMQKYTDLQRTVVELEQDKAQLNNKVQEEQKLNKRRSVLHKLVTYKRDSETSDPQQYDSEKILLQRIESLNRQFKLDTIALQTKIDQLEEELQPLRGVNARLKEATQLNEKLERELDLVQSDLLMQQQTTKSQGRRHTLNQQELMQQLHLSSDQQDLAARLAKQERVHQWEKEQLTCRISQLEQEVLDLQKQVETKPEMVKQEMEVAAQMMLQSEMQEHQKSIQQLQRRHTIQQMNQEAKMNSMDVFAQSARMTRLHELETQELKSRIHQLENELLEQQAVDNSELKDQLDQLKDQLEQSLSHNLILENELQTLKRTLQTQHRRATLNQEELKRMLVPEDVNELTVKMQKQERIFAWEKEQLNKRITQLEEEILSQPKKEEEPAEVKHDIAIALYLQSEMIEHRKSIMQVQRRLTAPNLEQFVENMTASRIHELETGELRNRITQLEQEILDKGHDSSLQDQLEQANARILLLEHELQIEKQNHSTAKRRHTLSMEGGEEQRRLKKENEQLREELQQLKLGIKQIKQEGKSPQKTVNQHPSPDASEVPSPVKEMMTLRQEFSRLSQQQLQFQEQMTSQFNQLKQEVKTGTSSPARLNESRQHLLGYSGESIGFLKHGQGVQHYADTGCTYEGEWRFNKRHGFGELRDVNGALVYRGDWSFDEMTGQGELHNRESVCEEDVDPADLRSYTWLKYVGGFKRGSFHGQGKLLLVNGDVYEGHLDQGVPDGTGIYRSVDGQTRFGKWQKGILISYNF